MWLGIFISVLVFLYSFFYNSAILVQIHWSFLSRLMIVIHGQHRHLNIIGAVMCVSSQSVNTHTELTFFLLKYDRYTLFKKIISTVFCRKKKLFCWKLIQIVLMQMNNIPNIHYLQVIFVIVKFQKLSRS